VEELHTNTNTNTNTDLTRQIHQLTTELHARLLAGEEPHSDPA
jgi:hypothetical protein